MEPGKPAIRDKPADLIIRVHGAIRACSNIKYEES